jgi:hypothetical protein
MRLAFCGAMIGAARLLVGLKRPLIMEIRTLWDWWRSQTGENQAEGAENNQLRDEIGELSFSS